MRYLIFILLICSKVVWAENVNCEEDVENSAGLSQRIFNCQTLKNAMFGDEQSCLRLTRSWENILHPTIAPSSYFNSPRTCITMPTSNSMAENPLGCSTFAKMRDLAINEFFQDMAVKAVEQIDCRLNTISISYSKDNSLAKSALLTTAREKFRSIRKRVRGLTYSKQKMVADVLKKENSKCLAARQSQGELTQMFAGALAPCNDQSLAVAKATKTEYEKAIAEEVAKVPWGYEPEVADRLLFMALYGEFDDEMYLSALANSGKRYRALRKYYEDRTRIGTAERRYCIDEKFKEEAVKSGAVDKMLLSYPQNIMNGFSRNVVSCRLNSKYGTAREGYERAEKKVVFAGEVVATAVAMVATEGTAAEVLAATAAAGLSEFDFALQLKQTIQTCSQEQILISASGSSECHPEQNFDHEMKDYSQSACVRDAAVTAFMAVEIWPEVRELAESSEPVTTIPELVEELAKKSKSLVPEGVMVNRSLTHDKRERESKIKEQEASEREKQKLEQREVPGGSNDED